MPILILLPRLPALDVRFSKHERTSISPLRSSALSETDAHVKPQNLRRPDGALRSAMTASGR